MPLFIQIILFGFIMFPWSGLLDKYLHKNYVPIGINYFIFLVLSFGLCAIFMLPILNTILGYSYNLEFLHKIWWDWGYWLFRLEINSSGNWWNVVYYLLFYPAYLWGGINFIMYAGGIFHFLIFYHLLGGKWESSLYVLKRMKEKDNSIYSKIKNPLWNNLDFQLEIFILYCQGYITDTSVLKPEWFECERFIELIIEKGYGYELISICNGDEYPIIKEKLSRQKKLILYGIEYYASGHESGLFLASEHLRNDKEIVLIAVSKNQGALEYASEELRNDKEIVLAAVNKCGSELRYASEELRNDKEIVLAAVNKIGWVLEYASEELKNDEEVVETALKNGLRLDPWSHRHKFSDSRPYMQRAIKKDVGHYVLLSERLLQEQELFDIALNNGLLSGPLSHYNYGLSLRKSKPAVLWMIRNKKVDSDFVTKLIQEFHDDKEVILETAHNYGYTDFLKCASDRLRNDREIVLAAVNKPGLASGSLEYASKELRSDKKIVLIAVSKNEEALKYVSEELRNDREIVLAAVSKGGWVLKYASEELKNDVEVVLAAVNENGLALEYASQELRNNMEIVLVATKNMADAIKFAGKECIIKIRG